MSVSEDCAFIKPQATWYHVIAGFQIETIRLKVYRGKLF